MTFAELYNALTARGVLTLAPQKKSALVKLAQALGYKSLEACPVGDDCREEASWLKALDAHFDARTATGKTISAYTRRNTRSDLRTVFKLAEAHGLLAEPLLPLLTPTTRTAFEKEQQKTSPYRSSYKDTNNKDAKDRYRLRQDQWPPDIHTGWRTYRVACGRRIRETTAQGYVTCLETYFGYLHTICKETPTWEDLFDVEKLNAFVSWHGARVGQDVSAHGWHVVIGAAAIARVVGHAHADAVLAFSRTVERPPELHRKRPDHWVSLVELDRVANIMLAEGRRPYLSHSAVKSPGVRGATRFQLGLMLKFLTRVPMRSRNLREMRLGKNLFKDKQGHWRLEFRGAELKVGRRAGRINEYSIDLTAHYPPKDNNLLPVLEEFLTTYRPRIPHATPDGLLFLSQLGTPHDAGSVRQELSVIVARHTGVRWYPHMVRTTWGSEYLEDNPGDFATVATMLGDSIPVVIKTYFNVVPEAQQAKAGTWNSTKFGRGGRAG